MIADRGVDVGVVEVEGGFVTERLPDSGRQVAVVQVQPVDDAVLRPGDGPFDLPGGVERINRTAEWAGEDKCGVGDSGDDRDAASDLADERRQYEPAVEQDHGEGVSERAGDEAESGDAEIVPTDPAGGPVDLRRDERFVAARGTGRFLDSGHLRSPGGPKGLYQLFYLKTSPPSHDNSPRWRVL